MKQYLKLLNKVLTKGQYNIDRTGTGTLSIFGTKMSFDLEKGFPLLTTKKIPFKLVASELLWFIQGEEIMNVNSLKNIYSKNTIWDEWADGYGELGPIYGSQWRRWPSSCGSPIDQLYNCINSLSLDPSGRRHLVSSWNVSDLPDMALPPCHMFFQFFVRKGEYLDCQIYQRSCDMFLGVPFNIASYSLLTHMVGKLVGLKPGKLNWVGGDTHIYLNHVEQVYTQLSRTPFPLLPKLEILGVHNSIDSFKLDDFKIINYNPQSHIAAEISV